LKKNIYIYFLTLESFFTDVSKTLYKINDNINISGLTTIPLDFLKNFNYKSLSFLSDIKYKDKKVDFEYLKKIENEYNLKVSEIVHLERYSYKLTHQEKLSYIEGFIKKIESDYFSLNFDIVLSGGLCDGVSYFLYKFCIRKGIKFYYHIPNRFGSEYYLSDHPDSGPIDFIEKYNKNLKLYENDINQFNKTFNIVNNYLQNKSQPDYLKDKTLVFKYFTIQDLKILLNALLNRNKKIFHGESNIFKLILQRLHKFKQKFKYQSIVTKNKGLLKENDKLNYFIFPLQFHPESATILLGKWFHNQVEILKIISRILPVDVKILVKEHPHSIGRRPAGFYEEISKLHNIVIINSNYPVNELINKSLGVITISSTMGLEAILKNKPVILFGDIHYGVLSEVIKATDLRKIEHYINEALNFKGYKENQKWAFLKTIFDRTMTMASFSPYNFDNTHVKLYVDFLLEIHKEIIFE
jgi:hypothetical protein